MKVGDFMTQGIADYKINDSFDGFMLIKEVNKGIASNGKPFLTLIFRDKTGEIDAKLWGATPEDEALFLPEEIVKLTGTVNEFRGRAQFRIKTIRIATPADNISIADLLEKAPIEIEELKVAMTEFIFEMKNPNIQRIVRAFTKKYEEELYIFPAASKNHHAYVSGLAHHIISMLKIAKQLCELYPSINKDLLYAGVILHDIGKIHELSGAISTSYTVEGTLLGHISLMVSEIEDVAMELKIDSEEVLILQHLVLSHHGKAEWGSPKPPMIREAELLHFIDIIDAKMNMLDRALAKVEPGEFTERLFPMENRAFYKPTFDK